MLPQAAQLSQVALRLQGLGERIGIHGEGPGLPLDAELAVLDAPPGSLLDARYKSMGLTKVLDNAGLIVNPSHPRRLLIPIGCLLCRPLLLLLLLLLLLHPL